MFFLHPEKDEDGNLKAPHLFVSRNMRIFAPHFFFEKIVFRELSAVLQLVLDFLKWQTPVPQHWFTVDCDVESAEF